MGKLESDVDIFRGLPSSFCFMGALSLDPKSSSAPNSGKSGEEIDPGDSLRSLLLLFGVGCLAVRFGDRDIVTGVMRVES